MLPLSDREYALSGYATLQELQQYEPDQMLDNEQVMPYVENPSHLKYLENPDYHRYLKIHKVALGISGYRELRSIGAALENEYMPRYLDAAAWAYAEAAIFDSRQPINDRLELLVSAEGLWTTALEREIQLETTEYSAVFDEFDTSYRLATSLAFTPLMESIIRGDVTPEARQEVLFDITAIANDVSVQMGRCIQNGNKTEVNGYSGLLHELNALSALLHNDDPRYVPMPATARADSGYYHREQTHDISIINQHWGKVKKVLPVEIKASPSLRDRRRYRALVIRGKMHLTPDGVDPRKTTDIFYKHARSEANLTEVLTAERLSRDVQDMLRLYQKGGSPDRLALDSLTRFYDSQKVADVYPGLAI